MIKLNNKLYHTNNHLQTITTYHILTPITINYYNYITIYYTLNPINSNYYNLITVYFIT